MRRFVLIGQRATTGPDFSLSDLPSSSGRLDVLVRCLGSALLVSHGLRHDTVVYLVLLGGPRPPRTLRFEGSSARFVRPDERSLAVLVKKVLATEGAGQRFTTMRPGIALAEGGLDAVLADLGPSSFYVLDERGPDLRGRAIDLECPVFFVGDHLGFDEATRARIGALGAVATSVGPLSVHAGDAVAIVVNELDRREA
jgi:tRNA (pseudouridine54-N1)-methyltransferase